MSMSSSDLIVFDRAQALHLWSVMSSTTNELVRDRIAITGLMDQADRFLGGNVADPVLSLWRAHEGLGQLTNDLKLRLDQIEALWSDVDRINDLTRDIAAWQVTDRAAELEFMVTSRRALVHAFLADDAQATQMVLEFLDEGLSLASAVGMADQHLFDLRVAEVQDSQGGSLLAAQEYVRHLDYQIAVLAANGFTGEEAVAGVALAVNLEIDITDVVDVSKAFNASLVDSVAWLASSRALGVTVAELQAMQGLQEHLEALDNPKGGKADGKVSISDLHYVVQHPWKFAGPTVLAAQALIDNPSLWNRFDTASANNHILRGDVFGSLNAGDGVVSQKDLEMFMVKSQIHAVLKEHRNEIDIAADSSGAVDGFYSRADLRQFIENNPQLPSEVLVAADTALEAGWFDRTWFEEHRDELALGAAVLAGGAVIILSAGAATPLVLAAGAAAGATAAASTALTINLTGDANDAFDGVLKNVRNGAIVGFTVVGLPATIKAVGATSGAARVKAVSLAATDVASLASCGALDIIVPEPLEDDVRGVGDLVTTAQTAAIGWSVGGGIVGTGSNPIGSLETGIDTAVDLIGCDKPEDTKKPEWVKKAESLIRSGDVRSALNLARLARNFQSNGGGESNGDGEVDGLGDVGG